MSKKEVTVHGLLHVWAMRESGGSLKNPLKISTGGQRGANDEQTMAIYVRMTAGYSAARPVLRHVYVEGKAIDAFRVAEPGELLYEALDRLKWWHLAAMPESMMAEQVLDDFECTLALRLREQPLVIVPEEEAPTPEQVANDVSANVDSKYGR